MELIRRYHPPNAYRSPPRGPTPPAGPGLLDSGHLTHWSLAPRFRGVLSCSAGEAWRSCQPGLALLRRDVLERHPDCTGAEGMQELDCRSVSRLRLAQRRGVRGSSQFTVLFVVATVLFALGHVLLAIGFWIRNKLIEPNESWWDRSWNCVLLRFAHCRDQVEHYNCATRTRAAGVVQHLGRWKRVDGKRACGPGDVRAPQAAGTPRRLHRAVQHTLAPSSWSGSVFSRRGGRQPGVRYLFSRRCDLLAGPAFCDCDWSGRPSLALAWPAAHTSTSDD